MSLLQCAVNNFHIGRHISREHTQRAAASTLTPPPNNDAPVRDEAQIVGDDNNFEAVITDDEYDVDDEDVTSDDEDDSHNEAELEDEDYDEDDEAEKPWRITCAT